MYFGMKNTLKKTTTTLQNRFLNSLTSRMFVSVVTSAFEPNHRKYMFGKIWNIMY